MLLTIDSMQNERTTKWNGETFIQRIVHLRKLKMLDILNIPELGKLEIVEVYEYYDQPVLYSCKNAADHFYLVVAADENNKYVTWLCVAVSKERLNLIRSGKIDLHDAFAHSENAYTITVRVPYDEYAAVQTDWTQSCQVPEDMLPIPGECLDLEPKYSQD